MKKLTIKEMEYQILMAIHSEKSFSECFSFSVIRDKLNYSWGAIIFRIEDNHVKYVDVFLDESDDEEVKKRKLDIVINAIHGDKEALETIWEGNVKWKKIAV